VWAGYLNQYVIELFDRSGRRINRIVRNASWFRPWSEPPPPAPNNSPPPQLIAIQRSGANLLSALILVPGTNWRTSLTERPAPPGSRGPPAYSISRVDRYYSTTLEVFDSRTGVLLASRAFPELIFGYVAADRVVSYHEDDLGMPSLGIWRLSFHDGR
jgi:hypothetical protein